MVKRRQNMIDRKECEFFKQHYGYCKRDMSLHTIYCGHCLFDVRAKTCKNCPNFKLREEKETRDDFTIMNCFLEVEKSLKKVKKELKRLKLK